MEVARGAVSSEKYQCYAIICNLGTDHRISIELISYNPKSSLCDNVLMMMTSLRLEGHYVHYAKTL